MKHKLLSILKEIGDKRLSYKGITEGIGSEGEFPAIPTIYYLHDTMYGTTLSVSYPITLSSVKSHVESSRKKFK